MPKLKKTYPDYLGEGGAVFTDLENNHSETFEWLENIGGLLDAEYFGNHSGNKETSPLIDDFIENNYDEEVEHPVELTTAQRTLLSNIIANKYANKWSRLYAIMSAEYNPIENYSMTEEEVPDITKQFSVSDNYAVTNETTKATNISTTETPSNDYKVTEEKKVNTDLSVETDTTTSADVYGFNSTAPVPSNEGSGNSTVTTSGDEETNKETTTKTQEGYMTITEEGSAQDNIETNTQSQTGYRQETETGTRTLTRSGNIGVTTSQQMIESEIALWQWNFFEMIFKDVDTILTSPKYNIERGHKYEGWLHND